MNSIRSSQALSVYHGIDSGDKSPRRLWPLDDLRSGVRSDSRAQFRHFRKQPKQCDGLLDRRVRFHEEAVLAVGDDLRQSANIGGDDNHSEPLRFKNRQWNSLEFREKYHHIRPGKQRGETLPVEDRRFPQALQNGRKSLLTGDRRSNDAPFDRKVEFARLPDDFGQPVDSLLAIEPAKVESVQGQFGRLLPLGPLGKNRFPGCLIERMPWGVGNEQKLLCWNSGSVHPRSQLTRVADDEIVSVLIGERQDRMADRSSIR